MIIYKGQHTLAHFNQLSLNALIERLKTLGNTRVELANDPDSYRGHHDQLAFPLASSDSGRAPANVLLDTAVGCLGREFTGYRGGEFVMGSSTPVWVSNYGTASELQLIWIASDGEVIVSREFFDSDF